MSDLLRTVLKGLVTEALGYHGSPEANLTELIPDPHERKVLSSLGTWFTSVPERAEMYGDHIYELEIPEGNFMEAPTENFGAFFFDPMLVTQHMEHIKNAGSMYYLALKWWEYTTKGEDAYSWRKKPRLKKAELEQGEAALWDLVFGNWGYLQAWRAKQQAKGFDGIVWRNSSIDSVESERHDVYLFFGPVPIKRKLKTVER